MSILLDRDTTFIVQGITGREAVNLTRECLDYGTGAKIAIFRIPGAWEEEGFKILEKYGVEYADRSTSLNEAARLAVEGAA